MTLSHSNILYLPTWHLLFYWECIKCEVDILINNRYDYNNILPNYVLLYLRPVFFIGFNQWQHF